MTLINRKSSKFPEKFDFYSFFGVIFYSEVMPGPSGGKSLFAYFDLTKSSFKAKVPSRDLNMRTDILKSMTA